MWSRVLQSNEGARLVETQVQALFGDLKMLQDQMQQAVGQDATSMEDLMQRVQVGLCNVTAVAAAAVLAGVSLPQGTNTSCVLTLLHRLQHQNSSSGAAQNLPVWFGDIPALVIPWPCTAAD